MGVFLQNFFSGHPPEDPASFWNLMDFTGMTDLQIQVYRVVAGIPYGQVATYRDIAVRIGRPAAARFIGNTMARNPFPVIIPCHRVIRTDGTPGGFGGGIDLKLRMLAMEKQGCGG
jgi:methylated-DNA-[protein]-cysteine S-methyltransferase